jgi:hypothetical protein
MQYGTACPATCGAFRLLTGGCHVLKRGKHIQNIRLCPASTNWLLIAQSLDMITVCLYSQGKWRRSIPKRAASWASRSPHRPFRTCAGGIAKHFGPIICRRFPSCACLPPLLTTWQAAESVGTTSARWQRARQVWRFHRDVVWARCESMIGSRRVCERRLVLPRGRHC